MEWSCAIGITTASGRLEIPWGRLQEEVAFARLVVLPITLRTFIMMSLEKSSLAAILLFSESILLWYLGGTTNRRDLARANQADGADSLTSLAVYITKSHRAQQHQANGT